MADPISILASAVSIADVCIRLSRFLREAKRGIQSVDEDLDGLLSDITTLQDVINSIAVHFKQETARYKKGEDDEKTTRAEHIEISDLWRTFHNKLTECLATLEDFDTLRKKIEGDSSKPSSAPAIIQHSRKWLRKYMKEDEINLFRQKISRHHDNLNLLLTAANAIHVRMLQSTSAESVAQIKSLRSELRVGINSLQERIKASNEISSPVLQSTRAVMSMAFVNEHFSLPQPVSSLYTGRRTELNTLKTELFRTQTPEQFHQRRFVVYGLGGAGKSQFCCKFAQENRHSFWGVFSIDATTPKTAKESFARIAKMGKVDGNMNAAKAWLSSKDRPFLLIIDNADDPDVPLEEYFPEGERGVILITTRNFQLKTHGTVGPRFFHFKELDNDSSSELLLRTAGEGQPWDQKVRDAAARICQKLGFLPLGIILAGRAIMSHLCTLYNYLSFFEESWARVREIKRRRRGSHVNLTVYSSYEVAFKGLLQRDSQASIDAVELLNTFAFLHNQRIRVDVLIQAATNPKLETDEAKKREQEAKDAKKSQGKGKPLSKMAKELGIDLVRKIMLLGEFPVLPKVLRDVDKSGKFNEARLREALAELHRMSLVDYDRADDSYSMHPLVHIWVRERPEMSLAEQAVWCQAAGTILSQAVLLPPLGVRESDEDLRRDIFPHVDHVRKREIEIQEKITENQSSRRKPWPTLGRGLARSQVAQLAKFSLVYAQNGYWQEALDNQKIVADFIIRTLGKDHPITIRLLLFMADTYWPLGQGDNASILLEDLLEHCKTTLGEDDEDYIRVLDKLGMTRWMQGKFNEARDLHEIVVQKLIKLHGTQHADTLRAMSNLGRVYSKYFRYEESITLHEKALEGLEKHPDFGRLHSDTLMVLDNLAMAHFDRYNTGALKDIEDLNTAHTIQIEVIHGRKKKLGKEHGYTLWSMCNLARVKAALGELQTAEHLIRNGLPIAIRNLGETHIGTLYGKAQLGNVLMLQERLPEAEIVLADVYKLHEEANKGHPDQIVAMAFLVGCYQRQGKDDKALVLRKKLLQFTKDIFGPDSPWEEYFLRKYGS